MKALKICSILTAAVIASSAFSSSIAQTFSSQGKNENNISPRQKLVIELLRKEIKNNKNFYDDGPAILAVLDNASVYDSIEKECFKYTPLLINILNKKEIFVQYFNIQGNFGYSFVKSKNNEPIFEEYSFYERYQDNGELGGLFPSILIRKYDTQEKLQGLDATNYLVNNYCNPLNQILDQNQNMPIPQLLEVLHQRFSK